MRKKPAMPRLPGADIVRSTLSATPDLTKRENTRRVGETLHGDLREREETYQGDMRLQSDTDYALSQTR